MTSTEHLMEELALAQAQARLDPLTGLGNLLRLDEVLGRCFREGTPFSLALFDLASMKRVNTLLGYAEADAMLTRIGSVLRTNRGDGFAVRKGGDEFLVVLPRGTIEDAERVRDRVEDAVGVLTLPDGTKVFLAGGVSRWTRGLDFGVVMLEAQRELEARKVARR